MPHSAALPNICSCDDGVMPHSSCIEPTLYSADGVMPHSAAAKTLAQHIVLTWENASFCCIAEQYSLNLL